MPKCHFRGHPSGDLFDRIDWGGSSTAKAKQNKGLGLHYVIQSKIQTGGSYLVPPDHSSKDWSSHGCCLRNCCTGAVAAAPFFSAAPVAAAPIAAASVAAGTIAASPLAAARGCCARLLPWLLLLLLLLPWLLLT
jgi:hypothetical protein